MPKQHKPSLALVPVKKAVLTKEQKLKAQALKRARATVAAYSDWDIGQQRECTMRTLRDYVEQRMREFLAYPDHRHKKQLMKYVNEYLSFMAMNVAELRAQMLREEVEREEAALESWNAQHRRHSAAVKSWNAQMARYAKEAKRASAEDDPDIA